MAREACATVLKMEKTPNYKSTIYACWFAMFIMAVTVNFTPILFIPLRTAYGFSFTQLGAFTLVNFLSQVAADLTFSKLVDRHGFRRFVVAGQILCATGFLCFAAVPFVCRGAEYAGFMVSTVIFSVGAGLQELLLSPIIDSVPSDNPERAMTLAHSFYAWGQILTVAVTTVLLFVLGAERWPFILCGWATLPVVSTILFLRVPLRQRVEGRDAMSIRKLIVAPAFALGLLAILFAGASELSMSQWASSFMERAVGLPKMWGDLLGMAGFAVMLAAGRLLHGLFGDGRNLRGILIAGSAGAVACYVAAALTSSTALGVIACCLTGLGVSLLWPATLTLTARSLPLAGASMFALMAAGGDIGCAAGPWFTGLVTDFAAARLSFSAMGSEQVGLRAGLLVGVVFPLGSLIVQIVLRRMERRDQSEAVAGD